MMTNLIIVTALAVSNFMIFLGLIFIILRSRHRHQDSFKITQIKTDLDATEIMPGLSTSSSEDTVIMDNRPLNPGRQKSAEPVDSAKQAREKAKMLQEAGIR